MGHDCANLVRAVCLRLEAFPAVVRRGGEEERCSFSLRLEPLQPAEDEVIRPAADSVWAECLGHRILWAAQVIHHDGACNAVELTF